MQLNKVIKYFTLFASLAVVSPAQATVIEQFCTCQGYARSGGLHIIGVPGTWLEDMHRSAVYFCETGQVHSLVSGRSQYGARSGGARCVPDNCPSGTIDLGTTITSCSGVAKSRFTPGTETNNVMAPAEGGCNYDDSNPNPNYQFVSCDLQCEIVRRCATASSH